MKLPVPPPPFDATLHALLQREGGIAELERVFKSGLGPAPGGRYRHWDTFRHAPPMADLSVEGQWIAVTLARRALHRQLPLRDLHGRPFVYALPDPALQMLHAIDRQAGGNIVGPDAVMNSTTRDTYLFKSIVEEAITSSQLEGASTTRRVAKDMIQSGRAPRTRSERMILNNYEGLRYARTIVQQPLTPDLVMELQRILTEETLDEPDGAGRLRRQDENVVVEDEVGTRLHTPPPAEQLADRLAAMCDFANATDDRAFMPPAVRAILLHFWLAYDHPFVDGNGRTARAVFYWSMARSGYWLCEYTSISRILRRARAQYARAYLYSESDDNDVTYFLLYQLRVLLRAIDELHRYLARKASELSAAQGHVQSLLAETESLNARQIALLNHAAKTPDARYTVASHQRSHGVAYDTARLDLLALTDLGMLEQRKLGKAFVFTPSLRVRAGVRDPAPARVTSRS